MFWKKKKDKSSPKNDSPKSPELYQKPNDVRELERIFPVMHKNFSIELMRMRYLNMSESTRKICKKTIKALETGNFYGKNYG